MKTEREMFEEWFCKNHTGLKPNDLLKFRLPEGYSFKDPIKINLMWEAWKSSASREGYKLVPLEPSAELVNHGHQVFLGHFNEGGQTGGRSLYFAYKAMLEAVEK